MYFLLLCSLFSAEYTPKEECANLRESGFSTRLESLMILLHYTPFVLTWITLLTIKLIQQSVSFSRYPDRLAFFDISMKRIGNQSFTNRAKKISELIPFNWSHSPTSLSNDLSKHQSHCMSPEHIRSAE